MMVITTLHMIYGSILSSAHPICDYKYFSVIHGGIQRGGGGGGGTGVRTPLKNHKNIGFLCNTDPDPMKNHIATKPAFNVGPSSARQQSTISMVFRWQANDGPFIAIFGYSIPPSTKKKRNQIWTPSAKLSGFAHAYDK